jgi:hypothetical protein
MMTHGLGYNPVVGPGGQIIDCDLWSNFFQGVCWNPFAQSPPTTVVVNPTTGTPTVQPDVSAMQTSNVLGLQTLTGTFGGMLPLLLLGGGLILVLALRR